MGLELNLYNTIKGLKIATATLTIITGALFYGSITNGNKYLNRNEKIEEIKQQENQYYINPNLKRVGVYNTGMLGTTGLAIIAGLSLMNLNDKKKKYSKLVISKK